MQKLRVSKFAEAISARFWIVVLGIVVIIAGVVNPKLVLERLGISIDFWNNK